jgi:hypothetical protein
MHVCICWNHYSIYSNHARIMHHTVCVVCNNDENTQHTRLFHYFRYSFRKLLLHLNIKLKIKSNQTKIVLDCKIIYILLFIDNTTGMSHLKITSNQSRTQPKIWKPKKETIQLQCQDLFWPKMSSKTFNPKLCDAKNTKYFPSIQIYTTKSIHHKK